MPASDDDKTSWIGRVRGHVSEAKARFRADKLEREAAGKLPRAQNIILTEREVRGDWDAARVLLTTLGGVPHQITADDLAAFRQNMRVAQKNFRGAGGITARQILDLASSRPLNYQRFRLNGDLTYQSDIDKAKREITMAVPVSARNDEIRFITNAGKDSRVSRHNVIVKLNAFNEAAAMVASTDLKDKKTPRQAANWLRKQRLAFDCDCERHRYFFRYVATIGGFAAGRKETGYPKIRNPHLRGVACKHVLRVMAELESSGTVLSFLEKHLARVSEYQARTVMGQKEAEAAAKRRKTQIKTSEQRKLEAQRARERRAAKKQLQSGVKSKISNARKPQKRPKPSPKISKQQAAEALAASMGITVQELFRRLNLQG